MPKLKHVTGGRQIEVAPDQVPMYESQGWQRVAPRTTTTKKTPSRSTTDAK